MSARPHFGEVIDFVVSWLEERGAVVERGYVSTEGGPQVLRDFGERRTKDIEAWFHGRRDALLPEGLLEAYSELGGALSLGWEEDDSKDDGIEPFYPAQGGVRFEPLIDVALSNGDWLDQWQRSRGGLRGFLGRRFGKPRQPPGPEGLVHVCWDRVHGEAISVRSSRPEAPAFAFDASAEDQAQDRVVPLAPSFADFFLWWARRCFQTPFELEQRDVPVQRGRLFREGPLRAGEVGPCPERDQHFHPGFVVPVEAWPF
ncbi:MAG: hypothetical protein P1V81_06645 [Planctomycetota bacterium]|nr:hypothetical protein [Planctomycetota bacterium]